MRMIMIVIGLLLLTGCPTQFVGDAFYPGGADACLRDCKQKNMKMGGFVYMGKYSSACVCVPVDEKPSVASPVAASAASAIGVVLQARAAAQNHH